MVASGTYPSIPLMPVRCNCKHTDEEILPDPKHVNLGGRSPSSEHTVRFVFQSIWSVVYPCTAVLKAKAHLLRTYSLIVHMLWSCCNHLQQTICTWKSRVPLRFWSCHQLPLMPPTNHTCICWVPLLLMSPHCICMYKYYSHVSNLFAAMCSWILLLSIGFCNPVCRTLCLITAWFLLQS